MGIEIMSGKNTVNYLNRTPSFLMKGGLLDAVNALPAKVQKAPANQWLATLKSLPNKGVKLLEIEDAQMMDWLASRGSQSITREQMVEAIEARQVTIKEVTLGAPRFRSYSHARANPDIEYHEMLYIANSQRDNIQDRIDAIEWEMESYNFDLERMSADPTGVLALELERSELLLSIGKAHDFSGHHFSSVMDGLQAKNLIAHGRELIENGLYLIEEIQSDWAQKGRRQDWKGIPKGPLVTDTKAWAGMVTRRMLQRAAMRDDVSRVAWIRGYARNGGTNSEGGGPQDGLDDFYMKTVNSIVEKAIAKGGEKTRLADVTVDGVVLKGLPCFDMTPAVRAQLKECLPMYSYAPVWPAAKAMSEHDQKLLMRRCAHLLGSEKHLRFVKKVYDMSVLREASGTYMNKVIQISLKAQNPMMALDHECFHFASDNLLSQRERDVVLDEFAPGSPMNKKVWAELTRSGQHQAASQCVASAEEAAAHGFALWAAKRLEFGLDGGQSQGVFEDLRRLVKDACAWLGAFVRNEKCVTAEDVFDQFSRGMHGRQQAMGQSSRQRMRA